VVFVAGSAVATNTYVHRAQKERSHFIVVHINGVPEAKQSYDS
jgi:hypothetical protein